MQNRKRDTDVQNRLLDSGRRWGWDVSRGQHRNMCIIYGETDYQPRLDAWDKCSGLVHWEDSEGSGREGGGRGGSGWGIHVNPWLIHINVWQNPLQYCKVISLQLKKKKVFGQTKHIKKWKLHCKNLIIHSTPSRTLELYYTDSKCIFQGLTNETTIYHALYNIIQ